MSDAKEMYDEAIRERDARIASLVAILAKVEEENVALREVVREQMATVRKAFEKPAETPEPAKKPSPKHKR